MSTIFERLIKGKVRFQTGRGLLSAEDIYDLSLQALDTLAKKTNKELKNSEEESFINVKTTVNTEANLKMDFLKHVIAWKLELKDKAATRLAKNAKITALKSMIETKNMQELGEKSSADLNKMLAELQEDA